MCVRGSKVLDRGGRGRDGDEGLGGGGGSETQQRMLIIEIRRPLLYFSSTQSL